MKAGTRPPMPFLRWRHPARKAGLRSFNSRYRVFSQRRVMLPRYHPADVTARSGCTERLLHLRIDGWRVMLQLYCARIEALSTATFQQHRTPCRFLHMVRICAVHLYLQPQF